MMSAAVVGNVLAAEAISGNMIPNGQAAWDQRVVRVDGELKYFNGSIRGWGIYFSFIYNAKFEIM